MTAELTRRYRFCASHRLHTETLSDSENQRVFGKCNNPYGHGHDYVLDVSVTGEISSATGLIVSLSALDRLVANEVLAVFSYRNVNQDLPEFANLVPTTENIALVIAERLRNRWADCFNRSPAYLARVSIQETDRNSFEVLLPADRGRPPSFEFKESMVGNA